MNETNIIAQKFGNGIIKSEVGVIGIGKASEGVLLLSFTQLLILEQPLPGF